MIRTLLNYINAKRNKPRITRSPYWRLRRELHLSLNSSCAVCGGKDALEVHHIVPVHVDSSLELLPSNLLTLCESGRFGINCHLAFGHLGNYRRMNLYSAEDANFWNNRLKGEIRLTGDSIYAAKKERIEKENQ